MKRRIAIGGFIHESNTFVPSRADRAAFETGHGFAPLSFGADILPHMQGVNTGLAGFIAAAPAEWDLVPLVWANAIPSGPVTREAYEEIAGEIVARIQAIDDLDAVYLDLHGAMVVEHFDDGEGELLRRIRAECGSDIPIVVSLDLHANVTPEMAEHASVMISYRTYPHVDMAETGRRCAVALAHILAHGAPATAFRALPFLIPTVAQSTLVDPCKSIYARLEVLEQAGLVSMSFNPAFPASDFPGCRPTVLAYATTQAEADGAADELAAMINAAEPDFELNLLGPDESVAYAMRNGRKGRPVVIADTQDNPGGGANSDTTGLLKALIAAIAENAAVGLIVDSAAARAAHEAGIGASVALALGGHSGVAGDSPLVAEFVVEALSDGHMRMNGPLYGDTAADLGLSACLRIGGIRIVLASHKVQMGDLEMFRYVGIEPKDQAILVVKSTIHFRAAFEPIAGDIIVAEAPGAMIADTAKLPWRNLAPDVRIAPARRSPRSS